MCWCTPLNGMVDCGKVNCMAEGLRKHKQRQAATVEKKKYILEGYIDCNPGYEFDLDVFLLAPVRQHRYGGNAGAIDEMVEEFAIDAALSKEWKNDDSAFWDWDKIKKRFERLKKKNQKSAYYWKRIIEVDATNDDDYEGPVYIVTENIGP